MPLFIGISTLGSLPIILIFLYLIRRRLSLSNKIFFVFVAYVASLLSAHFIERSLYSVFLEAWILSIVVSIGATVLYCVIFLTLVKKPLFPARKVQDILPQDTSEVEVKESGEVHSEIKWNPIVVAALIESLATIIVALIKELL